MNNPEIKKGLVGVIADETKVSKVMEETNSLTYRGYAVEELCKKKRFVDVAYLLFYDALPNSQQRNEFEKLVREHSNLSDGLVNMIKNMPKQTHPMDIIRTAVSYLGMEDPSLGNKNIADNRFKGIKIFAKLPTIIATCKRTISGEEIIPSDKRLDYLDNFFNMYFGEKPNKTVKKVFDISLILYAEHSFNASTFTARLITSSECDIYGAITGAIASLKGPLHGGANEAVMHTMLSINDPKKAEEWLGNALVEKKKIMGFGHRVYRSGDSRVPIMKKAFFDLAEEIGEKKWCKIYTTLAAKMLKEKNIHPNLDFPAGPAYYLMGFEIDFFTPFFVMSRITGWTAHLLEQLNDNKLIRPIAYYTGEGQRAVTTF